MKSAPRCFGCLEIITKVPQFNQTLFSFSIYVVTLLLPTSVLRSSNASDATPGIEVFLLIIIFK